MLRDPLIANDLGIGVAGGGVPWLPTQFGNLLYWGRADRGVTLSTATLQALNAWGATRLTPTLNQPDPFGGNTAVLYTDSVDGGATFHDVGGTVTNGQPGPVMNDIWLLPGTINIWAIQDGASSNSIYYTWATRAFSNPSGNISGQFIEAVGNWHHLRVRNSDTGAGVNPVLIVYSSVAAGSVNYVGAGTGTFSIYGPTITQDRPSAWADQSGNGYNFTQPVAAAQGFYQELDGSGLWIPTGMNGSPQIGFPSGGGTTHSVSNAALGPVMTGTGVPHTAVMLDYYVGNAGGVVQWYGNSPGAGLQIANNGSPIAGKICTAITENSGVQHNTISTTGFTTGIWSTYASSYDGNNVRQYVNNSTLDASSPNAIGAITETIPAMFIGFNAGWHREITLFGRALSQTEIRFIMNGMRARWGLPPI